MKFNEYSSVVVSAGYDQSVRAWDCRSHSTEPIQASIYLIHEVKHNIVNHVEVVILWFIKDDSTRCFPCSCFACAPLLPDACVFTVDMKKT